MMPVLILVTRPVREKAARNGVRGYVFAAECASRHGLTAAQSSESSPSYSTMRQQSYGPGMVGA